MTRKPFWAVLALVLLPGSVFADDGFFDSNGVKIHYVTAGSGEPVVLIHGWMADCTMWGRDNHGNPKLSALPGFQFIAMDIRGHGKSDKPHDKNAYGAEMAEDVVRLMDHLQIKKAHLFGYSLGAFIAGKVAATHPDRVASLIYADQAPLIVGTQTSTGPNEVDVFANAVSEGKDLGRYILFVSPPGHQPTLAQANQTMAYMMRGKDPEALALAGESTDALEVTPTDLQKCKAPTLFIFGGNESGGVKRDVDIARRALGRGEVKIIDGADHMTSLIRPEFSSRVEQFLRAHTIAKR